jgi:hypothetical protein
VPVSTGLIALRLKDRAPRPPGVLRRGTIRFRMYWYPNNPAPADVHLSMRGWYLDFDALTAAQRAFAPHLKIVTGTDDPAHGPPTHGP